MVEYKLSARSRHKNGTIIVLKIIEQKYWSTDIAVENETEKIVIQVDTIDSGTDTEDELETYDEDTEDDELMFMTVTLKLTSRRKHGG